MDDKILFYMRWFTDIMTGIILVMALELLRFRKIDQLRFI